MCSLPSSSTAAELAGESNDPPKVPVEAFRQGMVVIHPDYGIGKIISLGGSGSKRTASVRFSDETRTFRLVHSPLRPVGR